MTNYKDDKFNIETYKVKRKLFSIVFTFFKWLLIVGLSYIILYPVIKLIIPSITYITDVDDPAVIWLPSNVTFKTLIVAGTLMNYFQTLGITILYVALLVVIQTFVSSFVGYGFSRFNFPLKKFWLIILFLTMAIPYFCIELSTRYYYTNFSMLGLIKLFTGGKTINILGNTLSYILLNIFGQGLKSGLFIYVFIKFYTNIPEELEESALMDGAGFFKIYSRIILPNAKPAIITCIVLSFVWNYGDYQNSALFSADISLLSNVLLRNISNTTNIPKFVYMTYGSTVPQSSVNEIMMGAVQDAGVLLFMLPLVIGYLIIQKQFVESFERSGIVG